MWKLPRPILVISLMVLGILINKMPFLITIVADDLTQVPSLLFQWPAAVLVIPCREKDCINPSDWGVA